MQQLDRKFVPMRRIFSTALLWYNYPTTWGNVEQRYGYNPQKWGIIMKMLDCDYLARFQYRNVLMVSLTDKGLEKAMKLLHLTDISHCDLSAKRDFVIAVKTVVLTTNHSNKGLHTQPAYLLGYDLSHHKFTTTHSIVAAKHFEPTDWQSLEQLKKKGHFETLTIITTVDPISKNKGGGE